MVYITNSAEETEKIEKKKRFSIADEFKNIGDMGNFFDDEPEEVPEDKEPDNDSEEIQDELISEDVEEIQVIEEVEKTENIKEIEKSSSFGQVRFPAKMSPYLWTRILPAPSIFVNSPILIAYSIGCLKGSVNECEHKIARFVFWLFNSL